MSDAMHPTGRCECGGEGRCTWCLMNQWRQRATDADASRAEENAQVEHRCHQIEKIAMALGLDLEWSNLCDIGDEAIDAAEGLTQRLGELEAERDRLRADHEALSKRWRREVRYLSGAHHLCADELDAVADGGER